MAPVSKELLEWEEKQKVKETMYQTKTICFFGQSTPIILQNENGPCPLIAVCNILSLRNKLGLSPYTTCVSERKLFTLVGENLFISHIKDKDQKPVSDAVDILPLLAKGLDVNVRFTSINDIEFTRECKVFGLLDIPVYHGWLIDPQDTETSNAIGLRSYNTLMSDLVDLANRNTKDVTVMDSEEVLVEHVEKEYIAEEDEPIMGLELTNIVDLSSASLDGDRVTFETDPNKASHDRQVNTSEPQRREGKEVIEEVSIEVVEKTVKLDGDSANAVLESSIEMTEIESRPLTARQGELVKEFFDNNKTQLTVYGLICLHEGLEDRELCVFFRNNHLSTMLKYEGELYTLVTDLGYRHHPRVIWEKLSEVNRDTVHVSQNFRIYKPEIERGACDLMSLKKKRPYLYSAEASTSTSANLSSDQQQQFEEKQSQPQQDKVIQKQVLEGKQSQQVLEETQSQLQHDKVFQQQVLEGKQSQQVLEETQSQLQHDKVFQQQVLEGKQSQQVLEETQSQLQHDKVFQQQVLEGKQSQQVLEETQSQLQHDKVFQQQVLEGKQLQQVLEETQSQLQHDKVFQQQVLEGKQSQQVLEETQSQLQHDKVFQQVLEGKQSQQESEEKQSQQKIEEEQSQQEIEEEQSEQQYAEIFKQLVLEAKEMKQESEEKQPQRVSSAPLPTGSIAGLKDKHSIRPRTPPEGPTRTQPRSPTRDPPRNLFKKVSKRLMRKCSLM